MSLAATLFSQMEAQPVVYNLADHALNSPVIRKISG